jgi:flagellar biogenesis protein FliO
MDSTEATQQSPVAQLPASAIEGTRNALHKFVDALRQSALARAVGRRERRLRLCETLALGERRLLALVQFDNQSLLIGVTGNSITLLNSRCPAADHRCESPNVRDELRRAGGELR